MKIASGILALALSLVIFLQSCAVSMGGSILAEEATEQGGAVGILVALLFLAGGAFAFGVPKVSFVLMLLAGFFGVTAGTTTPYTDMTVWGVIAFILAIMNLIASRKHQKSNSQLKP